MLDVIYNSGNRFRCIRRKWHNWRHQELKVVEINKNRIEIRRNIQLQDRSVLCTKLIPQAVQNRLLAGDEGPEFLYRLDAVDLLTVSSGKGKYQARQITTVEDVEGLQNQLIQYIQLSLTLQIPAFCKIWLIDSFLSKDFEYIL